MPTKHLIRWAGLAALIAGLCFILLGLFHPPNVLASVTTTRWVLVHSAALGMCTFGLFGLTGLYARQAPAAGWLGLAGYLLLSLWLVLVLPFIFFETFLLPQVAVEAPAFAEGFLRVFTDGAGESIFGVLGLLWTLSDILFLISGLTFGIATLRAGVLSRWAAGLFTAGIGLAPVFGLLPHALEPLVAVPIGAGLAWLGYALWADRRTHVAAPARAAANEQLSAA